MLRTFRHRRIRDTSYLPPALRQFVDVDGDTCVDPSTHVTEVQTSSQSKYRAVKNLRIYDLKGVEVLVRWIERACAAALEGYKGGRVNFHFVVAIMELRYGIRNVRAFGAMP